MKRKHQAAMLLAITATAIAVALTWGAAISFAKSENSSATYYEDSLGNLCVGLPSSGGFLAPSCEWSGLIEGSNTGVGDEALRNIRNGTASNNTGIGYGALFSEEDGHWNTATGYEALYDNFETPSGGYHDTADGAQALYHNAGHDSAAFGGFALENNTTGNENVALGASAGRQLTTGSNNIDIANQGTAGEAATTRVGVEGVQTRAFVAGIYNKTIASPTCKVIVNSLGQLGCKSEKVIKEKEKTVTADESALAAEVSRQQQEIAQLASEVKALREG